MTLDLKKKYQIRLQRAVAQNDYTNAEMIIKALDALHKLQAGETIEWGDEPWEKELRNELSDNFVPSPGEALSLSASAVETYLECPLKYRFKQIDKIPESASRPQLTFGNIIHKVLERFHGSEGDITEDQILQILDEEWKSGEFTYMQREEKLKEQAVEMLKRYAHNTKQEPPDVLDTELKFSFDLDGIHIVGMIDRIDNSSNGNKVVDYKTSKRSTPAKNSVQLGIYSLYLQQTEDEILAGIPETATLYFLRDEEQPEHNHTFTETDLNSIREKITDVARGIRARRFEPCSGYHCDWCDYKNLACPAWES
jgi:RecB family exonuclease